MDQQLILQLSYLERRKQELSENLNNLDSQTIDLESFSKDIEYLDSFKGKDTVASLGRGVYIPSQITDKKLFIEVGAGIVLRKTPKEAKEIIETQIQRLKLTRSQILTEIDSCNSEFEEIISTIRQSQ